MKMILNCLVGVFALLAGCRNEQPRKADSYSDYISKLFQYHANLHQMATDGQQHWADIFKNARIPIARKQDLVDMIYRTSELNEQMDQNVWEIINQNIPKFTDENNDLFDQYCIDRDIKYFNLFQDMRDKHSFHLAFLLYNHVASYIYKTMPECAGDREIKILMELTALHGEHEWNAILADRQVEIYLKYKLITEIKNEQSQREDDYSEYTTTLFQYETNLCFMATNGQKYWAGIFKDTRIPLDRKMDLVYQIDELSQPNEQMAQKVREIVKQDVPKPTPEVEDYDYTNWKFCVLLENAREKRTFHEAFLIYNYIDITLWYSEPEGVGDREIAFLSILAALHGEPEWNAILTDKNVDIGLKRGLVIDIHDMARYGEYEGLDEEEPNE